MDARVTWSGTVLLFAMFGIAGCASAPEPPTQAEITNEVTAEATVRAIDRTSREVTLERSDGSRVTVVAGPEVRNFDQIAVGSTVQARYVESLSARRLEAGEPSTEPVAAVVADRAAPGTAPAAGVGAGIALTVRVESVDLDQHLVVFTDPEGRMRAVRAQRDAGRKFIAGLKPGDRVELVYGEALIVKLE